MVSNDLHANRLAAGVPSFICPNIFKQIKKVFCFRVLQAMIKGAHILDVNFNMSLTRLDIELLHESWKKQRSLCKPKSAKSIHNDIAQGNGETNHCDPLWNHFFSPSTFAITIQKKHRQHCDIIGPSGDSQVSSIPRSLGGGSSGYMLSIVEPCILAVICNRL